MIDKKTFQEYVLRKPTINNTLYTLFTFTSLLVIMYGTTFLTTEFVIIGLIIGSIAIGFSFIFTKNIAFPIGILFIYNLVVLGYRGSLTIEELPIQIFTAVTQGLFIPFVIYWVTGTSQYILAKLKRLEKPTDEKVTNKKLILGAVIAGILHGIMLEIQAL